MKFTSKDLMKAMGLQVGDKIKYHNEVFTIVDMPNNIGIENDMGCYNIDVLLNKDFEILPRPKRVGDLKCDRECDYCPIKTICSSVILEGLECYSDFTYYQLLEKYKKQTTFIDQEIYDLLKARLDKEVSE